VEGWGGAEGRDRGGGIIKQTSEIFQKFDRMGGARRRRRWQNNNL